MASTLRTLLIALAVASAGCAQQIVDVRSPDGSFSVRMPGQPEARTEAITTPSGPSVIHWLTLNPDRPFVDDPYYLVACYEWPDPSVAAVQAEDWAASRLANSLGGRITATRQLTPSYRGRETEIATGGGRVARAVITLRQARVYEMVVGGTPEGVGAEVASEFLGSLRVNPEE